MEKIRDLEKQIDKYFEEISDDELMSDLEEANYSFYKEIKTSIIDPGLEKNKFKTKMNTSITGYIHIDIHFTRTFKEADSYWDDYTFKLAA